MRPLLRALVLSSLALLMPVRLPAAPAPDNFADLAAVLLPAVVNISSSQTVKPGASAASSSSSTTS